MSVWERGRQSLCMLIQKEIEAGCLWERRRVSQLDREITDEKELNYTQ